MPIHLRCEPSDVAPTVLLVGDPGRARAIAEKLDGARCYNDHRGLLGFSGEYRGIEISVQTTGMGGPSAAIVVEELAMLGAKTLIRLGTCGGIGDGVGVVDLAIATASVPVEGTTPQYVDGAPFAPVADHRVTRTLVDASGAVGRTTHTGLFMTHDVFYQQGEDWERWRDRGVVAVEMEASIIFTVALLRGMRAGAVCLVVDRVADRDTWASDEQIAAGTEDLVRLGLEAGQALAKAP